MYKAIMNQNQTNKKEMLYAFAKSSNPTLSSGALVSVRLDMEQKLNEILLKDDLDAYLLFLQNGFDVDRSCKRILSSGALNISLYYIEEGIFGGALRHEYLTIFDYCESSILSSLFSVKDQTPNANKILVALIKALLLAHIHKQAALDHPKLNSFVKEFRQCCLKAVIRVIDFKFIHLFRKNTKIDEFNALFYEAWALLSEDILTYQKCMEEIVTLHPKPENMQDKKAVDTWLNALLAEPIPKNLRFVAKLDSMRNGESIQTKPLAPANQPAGVADVVVGEAETNPSEHAETQPGDGNIADDSKPRTGLKSPK